MFAPHLRVRGGVPVQRFVFGHVAGGCSRRPRWRSRLGFKVFLFSLSINLSALLTPFMGQNL